MSALGQKQTFAGLFDHLVRAPDKCVRDVNSERLSGLEVDHQLVFGRHLHRQVGRLFPLKDTIDVSARPVKLVDGPGPYEIRPPPQTKEPS